MNIIPNLISLFCWVLAILNSYLAFMNPQNDFILMCALITWILAALSSLTLLIFADWD
jgi:hypothetical protein